MRALRESVSGGETTAWIRLTGLGIEDAKAHGALCNTLNRLFADPDAGGGRYEVVVLDWSTAVGCTAEGLSFFATVVERLVTRGARVIVTEPGERGIRRVLEESGLRLRFRALEWVPSEASGRTTMRALARTAVFSRVHNESVDDFCDDLAEALETLSVPRPTSNAVTGTAFEMLHNVLSHSDAPHAAAAALFFSNRRPRVIQIGIADDGLGIPHSVLRHPRHSWLDWFSDATVTSAVLRDNLSSRGADAPSGEGGGGLARAVKKMLTETKSRLILRSGAALITLRSEDPDHFAVHRLTYGIGTQIRIEVALP